MNKKQKFVLLGMMIVIVVMLAYPPWAIFAKNHDPLNGGYGWASTGPLMRSPLIEEMAPKRGAVVNVIRLGVQVACVVVIGAFARLAFADRKQSNPASPVRDQEPSASILPPFPARKDR